MTNFQNTNDQNSKYSCKVYLSAELKDMGLGHWTFRIYLLFGICDL